MNYQEFLKSKIDIAKDTGFDISPDEINPVLLPHQKDAVRWAIKTSYMEVSEICGTSGCSKEPPYWDWSVMGVIDTLEGKHVVSPGDWIIRGVAGEFYPCKPDIFKKTYDLVEN